jgi:hypothetical protein
MLSKTAPVPLRGTVVALVTLAPCALCLMPLPHAFTSKIILIIIPTALPPFDFALGCSSTFNPHRPYCTPRFRRVAPGIAAG